MFGSSDDLTRLKALHASEHLFSAFANAPIVGVALCDCDARFLAVNDAPAINGISVESHAGSSARKVLGEITQQ
jgi:hypothetical protein